MVLKSDGVELARSDRRALVKAVEKRRVPLSLAVNVALKVKVGFMMLKIGLEHHCDVTVDELTAQARIVHKDCNMINFDIVGI
jgi:hypothetical protein